MTGSTLGTSWDSLPARSSDVTGQHLPCAGLEPGRPAEELREGRGWEFPGKHCSRWPAWLSNSVTSAARLMGGLFLENLCSLMSSQFCYFFPSLINALISPQLLLFLEMRFLFLLQGHDPKDPKPLTHLYILRALAFLSSFSPHLSARHITHSVKVVCGIQGQMLLRQQACKPVCRSRCFITWGFPHLHLKAPGQQPQSKPSP